MLKQIRSLAKNKKGVSQFVELIVIIGLTIAVGAVAVTWVWTAIDNAKKYTGAQNTTPDNPNGPTA